MTDFDADSVALAKFATADVLRRLIVAKGESALVVFAVEQTGATS